MRVGIMGDSDDNDDDNDGDGDGVGDIMMTMVYVDGDNAIYVEHDDDEHDVWWGWWL